MAGNTDLIAKLKVQNQEAKQKLNETKEEVKALKAELSRLGKSVKVNKASSEIGGLDKMIGKLTGSAGGASSAFGILTKGAGALGIAMGAAEVAGAAWNLAMDKSQTLADEVGRQVAGAKGAVDAFAIALVNCDFSIFSNGLDNIISKAKEAYDALDDLWNMQQAFGVQNARLNNEFQKNLIQIRELKKTGGSQEEINALVKRNQQIISQQAAGANKLYEQTIHALNADIQAGTGLTSDLTAKAIHTIVENDINDMKKGRDEFNRQYASYQKELEALREQYKEPYNRSQRGQGLISRLGHLNPDANYGAEYTKKRLALEDKYKVAIAARYLLENKSDKELGEFNDKLRQGLAYESQSIQNHSKLLRYIEDENKSTTGGTKKKGGTGGGTKKTGPVFNEGANTVKGIKDNIQYLQNMLDNVEVGSDKYAVVNAELKKWQKVLDDLSLPDARSMAGMQNALRNAQDELAKMIPNTDEYKSKLLEVEDISKKIADQELKDMEVLLKENAETVDDINNNLKVYQALQNKCVRGSENWLFYQKKIKEETMKMVEWEEGSQGQIDHMIEELQKELQNKKLDVTARIAKVEQLNKLQNQKVDMNNLGTVKAPKRDTSTQIKESDYNNLQGQARELELKWKLGEIDTSSFRSQIKQIKAEGEQMFGKGFQVEVEMPMSDIEATLANASAKFDQFADNASSIANVYSAWDNFREVVDNGGNAVEQFMAIIQAVSATLQGLQTVMNLVNTITEAFATKQAAAATEQVASSGAVVAAKSGEAVAGATASGAKMPYPLNIIAIATGVAAVIAALAAISGAFAEGGIVGGSSSVGDHTLIRANKGEMVLNNRQQGNLFRLLDKGMPSYAAPAPTTTTFKLKGDSLVASLHNNNMSHSRTRGRRVSVI